MDIEKIASGTNIKYFCGDNCMMLHDMDFNHIFDESNKIYFMLKGSCDFVIENPNNNLSYTLLPGEMIIIPACQRHSLHKKYNKTTEPAQKLWVSFQFDSCGKNLLDLFEFPYVIKPKNSKKAEKLMKAVIDSGRQNSLISTLKVNAAIIELVTYFLEEAHAETKETDEFSMENIVQYINENLSHDFSLKELSDMAHMHPSYFIDRFRALKNTTPMKYITAKRMRHARSLLDHSTKSITEIMAEIGYTDPGHFSRTFKKYYDFSPLHYRNIFSNIDISAKSPRYTSREYFDNVKNQTKHR